MFHIIHISTVHGPLDNRIYRKECMALKSEGFDVTLIGNKNPDNGPEHIRFIPLKRRGRMGRMFINTTIAFRNVLKLKPDLVHLHDPELIPCGLILRLFRYNVVYDMHEDLPAQIYDKNWIPSWLHDPISQCTAAGERFLLRFFSGVVTVTDPLGERIRNRNICVLKNYPRKAEFKNLDAIHDPDRIEYTLLYIGSIAFFRGLREMVEATQKLSQNMGIKLILCGETASDDETQYLNKVQSDVIVYKGWQDRDQLRELYRNADLGLVILYPTRSHKLALPVKLFEYMGAGLPVLCSDFRSWADIVNRDQCGLVVNPLDVEAIMAKIIWLAEHRLEAKEMGRRGKEAVMQNYLWENEAPKLLDFYRTILN